jgi:uncharacterized membrane protein YfcA
MARMSVIEIVGVAVVFLAAGTVKGITGMGLPTVAVSLLGLWMAPSQAAALLVAPSIATNLAQCLGPHWRRLAYTLWPAWLGLVVVTVLMPDVGAANAAPLARRALGTVLVVYGVWGLWKPRLPSLAGRERWSGLAAGAATGVLTAWTAVFAIPLVPYLQALKLDKDALIQALGLSFMVATLALAWRLHAAQRLDMEFGVSLLVTGAAFVGLGLGSGVRARIGAAAFQRAVLMVLIALGVACWVR